MTDPEVKELLDSYLTSKGHAAAHPQESIAGQETPRSSEADLLRRVCAQLREALRSLEDLALTVSMREVSGRPPSRTIGVCALPPDGGVVKEDPAQKVAEIRRRSRMTICSVPPGTLPRKEADDVVPGAPDEKQETPGGGAE